MLKILQARLWQYMNREFPNVQDGFRKSRGTRDQIASSHWITEKAREFQKNIYFASIYYTKTYDSVDHNTLWKILKEMGTRLPYLLLRNLHVGQEATFRVGHGTTDWLEIRKVKVKVPQSRPTLCDPMECNPMAWSSPGQNTGVGRLSLLQGIFPTQKSNWDLLHHRQIFLPTELWGKPWNWERSTSKLYTVTLLI